MTLSRRHLFTGAAAALAAPAIISANTAAAQPQQAPILGGDIRRDFVGNIEVIALWDGFAPLPNGIITGFDAGEGAAAAAGAYKHFDAETSKISINGYIIKTADRIIAVDTGAPPAMAPTVGRWQQSLALAGLTPDMIDSVFLTHMHGDHVAGLTDITTGAARLPGARLIAAQAEWDFTFSDEVYNALPAAFQPNIDLARGLIQPYRDVFEGIPMQGQTDIAPGVTAIPLPGHTPGHMGLLISDGDEHLLIWGDAVHLPAFQFAHPDWGVIFDADHGAAAQTRKNLLDMAATDRLRVGGMHLDFPSLGYVERSGDSYRYIPAPASYHG
ncbi:MBL fold metallo-hydrolase [Yoonia sp. BS5-3]|uniref:MBL fold metallo-hydrolase n=1 Tax=Yoonia phaeophyticola TaxID=3137369 RepID=A0ABZ2V3J3_9RHOB